MTDIIEKRTSYFSTFSPYVMYESNKLCEARKNRIITDAKLIYIPMIVSKYDPNHITKINDIMYATTIFSITYNSKYVILPYITDESDDMQDEIRKLLKNPKIAFFIVDEVYL